MEPLLDPVAYPNGRRRWAPERWKREADQPEIDLLIDCHTPRRHWRGISGVPRHVAIGPVGGEAVPLQGRQVNRVCCLDPEAAHARRRERDADIVLLGAEHRLALVDDLNGQSFQAAGFSRLGHGGTAGSCEHGGEGQCRPLTLRSRRHKHRPNSLHAEGSE